MKPLRNILRKALLLFLLPLSCIRVSFSQDAASKSHEIKNLVDSKRFVFEVQTTLPQSGATKYESYGFFLKVSGDTMNCYLPYYGRATMPPMNPAERPLDFKSTQFEYSVKERKKDGWDILISPKDQKNVLDMSLTVFDNGSASLHVISNNLESISYNGIVTAIKRK